MREGGVIMARSSARRGSQGGSQTRPYEAAARGRRMRGYDALGCDILVGAWPYALMAAVYWLIWSAMDAGVAAG